MAESRIRTMSTAICVAMVVVGAVLVARGDFALGWIVLGTTAMVLAAQVTVPAPSGERLYLAGGIAAAVPLLTNDLYATGAIFSFGMAGAWLAHGTRRTERSGFGAGFLADSGALGGYTAIYFTATEALAASSLTGPGSRLLAVVAAGLGWYVIRASIKALIGLERDDLSPRYLWLLALEDWSAVLSLFATGALFGLTFPAMRWWAVPVAMMPYAFSHLAFVRYHGTRVTYGQTIRALAQIPEVAGLTPDGHSGRTAELATAMARELGMHPDAIAELEFAALMHDIGRITLNEPAILRAGYTDEDIARWGAQIIAEAKYLSRVADLVREQHRPYRTPGTGRDPEVPAASKIIKVASAYDNAVHDLGLRPLEALELIHRGSAYDFDPDVATSLRKVLAHRRLIAV